MHRAGRRWKNALRRLVAALGNFVTTRFPSEASIESHVAVLVASLELRAETTSYAMALADESFDRLQAALERHAALGRQAEAFYRAGETEQARRCVSLQVQLSQNIAELQQEYEAYQNDAERHLELFYAQAREVRLKSAQLPKLQEDLRLIHTQEKLQQLEARSAAGSAPRAFDEAAREVRSQKLQLQDRLWLELDPSAAVNRDIDRVVHDAEVEGAMAILARRVEEGGALSGVSGGSGTGRHSLRSPSADAVAAGAGSPGEAATQAQGDLADPVAAARQRLAMPRYQGLSRRVCTPDVDPERG